MNGSQRPAEQDGPAGPLVINSKKPCFEPAAAGKIKNRIADYWSQRVEDFSGQRLREFHSKKHEFWLSEFAKRIPMDRPLNILDLGTGTGFFSFLLASAGHRCTGIDLTWGMIKEARRLSKRLGLPADFYVMDAERPDFAGESFDALVSRNLTWTLPRLDNAYRAWRGLLKPGGVLINFDADYCHESKNQEVPADHAHRSISTELKLEYEKLKDELRPRQKSRPQWDHELLSKAGFHDISIDTSVWARAYRDVDEFYNPTPIFMIVAHA